MTSELTYEYISEDHLETILKFDCSDEISVERFLKEEAFSLHKFQTAITRLYFDNENHLVGYFTLHNDLVQLMKSQKEKYEEKFAWELPKYKFLPSIKLHYLGVDSRYRGKGFGEFLLGEVIQIARDNSKNVGCNFITVEALWSSKDFYEKYGFKSREKDKEFLNMIFNLTELYKPPHY